MQQSTTDQCIRRWPTQVAKEWITGFLKRVRRNQNVLAVVGIGSAVREGVRSDDLDILVHCRSARAFSERAPLEIDLRVFAMHRVDQEIEEGNELLGWAVVFGRTLFDRRGTWLSVVERWRGRVPLPNPDIARSRSVVTR